MKTKEFIEKYHKGTLGEKTTNGNYKAEKGKLLYTGQGRNTKQASPEVLAITLKNGTKLYNASQLNQCGSYTRGTQAPAQQWMTELQLPMVPFNVFTEAKLNIQNAKVIEQGRARKILAPKQIWNKYSKQMENIRHRKTEHKKQKPTTKKNQKTLKLEKERSGYWKHTYLDLDCMEQRHFVGAMLIKVGKKTFLFDIDRNEIKHHNINAFLVEVQGTPKTIKQAYQSLKPKEVVQAEKKKLKVRRQGEWFLIPDKNIENEIQKRQNEEPDHELYDLPDDFEDLKRFKLSYYYRDMMPKYRKQALTRFKDYNKDMQKYESSKKDFEQFRYGGELRAGNNRPNTVSKMVKINGKTYVKGRMTHSGREHEPIELKGWHEAIPNTGINSFTIEGNID